MIDGVPERSTSFQVYTRELWRELPPPDTSLHMSYFRSEDTTRTRVAGELNCDKAYKFSRLAYDVVQRQQCVKLVAQPAPPVSTISKYRRTVIYYSDVQFIDYPVE